jgi:carboxylesterase
MEPESARFVYDNISSDDKMLLWLKNSGHNLVAGEERDRVFDKSFRFVRNISLH